MNIHETYMLRCIELAAKGLGYVAPNPMVGAVIVHEGKIIGEGYHQRFGEAHAEVNAIASVKNKDLLAKSTLYVNLEPCAHQGKTPPCTDLIIENQIPEVVIANTDPNPLVNKKGIKKLLKHGIKVKENVLEKNGRELNKRFFTFHELKRPYIILKWARTLDGFIDINRDESSKSQPTWITGEALKILVHKWRAEEMAIMVGTNTAIMDDPQLNIRHWSGNDPVRIVIDNQLRLPDKLKLFDRSQSTLVYTSKSAKNKNNIEYILIDFKKDLSKQILSDLYNRGMQSLIIEGGYQLLDTFISEDYWDEARILTGNISFSSGIKAPVCTGNIVHSEVIENDRLEILINKNRASL